LTIDVEKQQSNMSTESGLKIQADRSGASKVKTSTKKGDDPVSCGAVPSYKNSKPKNYEDTKKTKYDSETKKQVPVVFNAGDEIPFKCKKGFTVDGSKDGDDTFDAKCTDSGFYKPSKVCIKASKCGEMPTIKFAAPTGKSDGENVQFACAHGYSLDGEKVVAGGMGKNQMFNVVCNAFKGEYEEFKGKCQPFGFVPAGQIVKAYNMVFEALFCASCEGTLRRKFGANMKPPKGLSKVCDHVDDAACSGLVTDIKADFKKKKKAVEKQEKKSDSDWMEPEELPGIKDEAKKFCEGIWKAIGMPSGGF